MNIIFTKHAKTRIFQREISEEDIRAAISHPDAASETFKDRIAYRKKVAKGTLEVICRKAGDKIIVITCYWVKEE